MAILHRATLTPSKLELLAGYLTAIPYFESFGCDELTPLGAYRFDDPAGEVGMESHLVSGTAGKTIHVPLTYRSAALDGADDWLVGTMEHSVLGPRWVYYGCADPVYVGELARTILTGGTEAEQYFESAEGRVVRDPTARVRGSGQAGTPVPEVAAVSGDREGGATIVRSGGLNLVVLNDLGLPLEQRAQAATLSGTWEAVVAPVVLAICF